MIAPTVTIIALLFLALAIHAIQKHIDFKRAHAEMLARIDA